MTSQTKLWALSAGALALSLALAGCGGGGSSSGPAAASGGGGSPPATPVTEEMASGEPTAVTMALTLPATASTNPTGFGLPEAGMSDTLTIAAGGTKKRGGVAFTCDSEYDCTVTLTNSAGTLVATWSSQHDEGETATVMAAVTPPALTPAASAAGLVTGTNIDSISTIGDVPAATLSKMKRTSAGVSFELADDFGPGDVAANTANKTNKITVAAQAAAYGMVHSDTAWGGGVHTRVQVHSNIGTPTSVDASQDGYLIGETSDYRLDRATQTGGQDDAYDIEDANTEVTGTQLPATAVLSDSRLTLANPMLDGNELDLNSQVTGTFDGVQGTFTCHETSDNECTLSRSSTTGKVTGTGPWSFKPNAGTTVMAQDRDWLTYGAWLTRSGGFHAYGIVLTGSDQFGVDDRLSGGNDTPAGFVFASLTGKSTYEGNAIGVYKDAAAAGMFTADAELTATFTDADGAQDMLSGTVDTFKDAVSGKSLGSWLVRLDADTDGFADPTGTDGYVASGMTSGTTDGTAWTGNWDATLYGDGTSAVGHPSSIGGSFHAKTATVDATTGTSVVGAFGAERKAE